jgi:hypothetical protein
VAGPDFRLGPESEDPLVQGPEDPSRSVFFVDREIGASDIVDEEAVAGQDM